VLATSFPHVSATMGQSQLRASEKNVQCGPFAGVVLSRLKDIPALSPMEVMQPLRLLAKLCDVVPHVEPSY
jgi:hypothetical protein